MDIAGLTQIAKEILLERKESRPLLFIELDDGAQPALIIFENFPFTTTGQRRDALFEQGAAFGTAHKGRHIKQLCFLVEGWVVFARSDQPRPQCAPSEHPDRVEVLMTHVLDVIPPKAAGRKPSYKQVGYFIEILRDGSGDLVDLLPHKGEAQFEHGLLEYFLAGFEGAQLSEKELRAALSQKAHRDFSALLRRAR